MESFLAEPALQFIKRASVSLTIGCCLYAVYILLATKPVDLAPLASHESAMDMHLIQSTTFLESDALPSDQGRNIFSPAVGGSFGDVESLRLGALPAYLKIVGILIADKPQVIIEDTLRRQTYFIDATHPQAGIALLLSNNQQVVIHYRGQNISVPIVGR